MPLSVAPRDSGLEQKFGDRVRGDYFLRKSSGSWKQSKMISAGIPANCMVLQQVDQSGTIQFDTENVCERDRMTTTDRITISPDVMLGKPVIRGTRVTVELILRKMGEGATESELLDAYPQLSKEDIQAAMAYAANTLAHEETFLLKNQA